MVVMQGGLLAFIQGKAVERAQAVAVAKAQRLSDKALNKLEGQKREADVALAAVTLSAAGERMEDAREVAVAAAEEGAAGAAADGDAEAASLADHEAAPSLAEDEAAALAEEQAAALAEVGAAPSAAPAAAPAASPAAADEAAEADEAEAVDDDEAAALAEGAADGANDEPGAEDGMNSALSTFKGALFDLVGYMQINASFSNSMPEVGWPSSFAALSRAISSAFNVKFATQLGSADCLLASNVCYRTLNTVLIAMGFLLALPLSQLIARCCRVRCKRF